MSFTGLAEGVNLTLNFTSKPDDREIFVGDGKKSVTFKWTFIAKPKNDLWYIQFGYLTENGAYQSVVVKEFRNGSLYVVRKFSDEVSRKDRMETEKDGRAEFTFKNLQLKDSGKYFCGIKLRSFGIQHSIVNLLVAGKYTRFCFALIKRLIFPVCKCIGQTYSDSRSRVLLIYQTFLRIGGSVFNESFSR